MPQSLVFLANQNDPTEGRRQTRRKKETLYGWFSGHLSLLTAKTPELNQTAVVSLFGKMLLEPFGVFLSLQYLKWPLGKVASRL